MLLFYWQTLHTQSASCVSNQSRQIKFNFTSLSWHDGSFEVYTFLFSSLFCHEVLPFFLPLPAPNCRSQDFPPIRKGGKNIPRGPLPGWAGKQGALAWMLHGIWNSTYIELMREEMGRERERSLNLNCLISKYLSTIFLLSSLLVFFRGNF